MPHPIRLPGETNQRFRSRVEKTANFARLLIDAALSNYCIREFIADPDLPQFSIATIRQSPTVRIEFEEAYAIAGIGEGLSATRNKHWGDGPYVHPLRPDDPVDPMFILYVFKPGSRYNRRFEQRRRMKDLLGPRYRSLVERAKYKRHTKQMFLESLTVEESRAIRRLLHIEPVTFWRVSRGKLFMELPARHVQLVFPFLET